MMSRQTKKMARSAFAYASLYNTSSHFSSGVIAKVELSLSIAYLPMIISSSSSQIYKREKHLKDIHYKNLDSKDA